MFEESVNLNLKNIIKNNLYNIIHEFLENVNENENMITIKKVPEYQVKI